MKHWQMGVVVGGWLVLYILFAHLRSSPTFAQTVLFEDDFSHGFLKWEMRRNNDWAWSIKEGQAEAYINQYSTITEMIPQPEYWHPDWKNIVYELDFTPLEGVDKNISFNFQNLSNWYEIHFVDTFYNLVRVTAGVAEFNFNAPYVMNNGQTYRLKIIFNQGHIQIFVNGEKIADAVDSMFNNQFGRIGIKAGTGAAAPTRVRFDNILVTSLTSVDGFDLNVPLFKQTDPEWANQQYDAASVWSNDPTINRWGCALVSMVMILKYHGLHQLPNGSDITPSTLNEWLKTQPDGYVGQSALNWLAVTRLTRLISAQFNTPKLEYKRQAGSNKTVAQSEITNQKPVIFEIPGHFLVGSGLTADQQDFYIKDPAFAYTKFSQHNKELLSFRTFQPSQTDLSYFLVTHEPGLHIAITDLAGNPLEGLETFTDSITDINNYPTQTIPTTLQTHLPKPNSGQYLIKVWQENWSPFYFQLFTYDQQANVTVLEQTGHAGPQPFYYQFNYNKETSETDANSQWQFSYSFTDLKSDLQDYYQQKLIKVAYIYNLFKRAAEFGEVADLYNQKRYILLLRFYLNHYDLYFTQESWRSLHQKVDLLEQVLNESS